jgi:hypothetical protein
LSGLKNFEMTLALAILTNRIGHCRKLLSLNHILPTKLVDYRHGIEGTLWDCGWALRFFRLNSSLEEV